MGLPSLAFDSDLATTWRKVLTDNQLTVQQDDAGEGQDAESNVPKRVTETLWRVGDGKQELRILEFEFHDRTDGKFGVVFMPLKTRAGRQLFLQVQELLIAAGATRPVRRKAAK
jgi:hypothetical protein